MTPGKVWAQLLTGLCYFLRVIATKKEILLCFDNPKSYVEDLDEATYGQKEVSRSTKALGMRVRRCTGRESSSLNCLSWCHMGQRWAAQPSLSQPLDPQNGKPNKWLILASTFCDCFLCNNNVSACSGYYKQNTIDWVAYKEQIFFLHL